MNTPSRSPLKAWLTSLLAVCLMLPAWAWSRVGEITLVVGQFEVQRPAGPAQNLAKGDAILEGDIIKTTANGHVHIRFIDGGLVSVRPNSVFTIHEFRFNPAQPATSVVRLSLDRGEVRSISGQATHEAKDRFRLNTPLVAIGVKGTDFTTQATQGATRVTVNQGAIVMAPFDQNCKAQALGVCSGSRARELTADMVMASACLPLMFQAVDIDGEAYWDGGYAGNPSLLPLITDSPADDLLLVQINPVQRDTVPKKASDILDRINEVTFNASLLKEMRTLALMQQLVGTAPLKGGPPLFQRVQDLRVHMIDGGESLAPLGADSKTNTQWAFLSQLHDLGRDAAERWLASNRQDVGQRSSFDLSSVLQA